MLKKDTKKTEIAYKFFQSKVGQIISLQEIGTATGWAESTLKTYPSKKWYLFLEKKGGKKYLVTNLINNYSLQDFIELQSQKFLSENKPKNKFSSEKSSEETQNFKDKYGITDVFLKKIEITNYHCLKDLNIDGLDKKEVYFLGENGDGKTLLLKAILCALKWNFIEFEGMKKAMDNIFVHDNSIFLKASDTEGRNFGKQDQLFAKNVFAYGVHRSQNDSQRFDYYGFMSLFDQNQVLQSPEQWLKNLYLEDIEAKQNPDLFKKPAVSLENAKSMFLDILGKNIEIEVSSKGVFFVERGTKTDFDILSEGYKIVLIWLTDLLFRLTNSQPNAKLYDQKNGFTGIVLVDEINLHLHPKWEYELPQKLRAWFPNIQFIFSTHSPITVLGASEDAVFFRLFKENGKTQITPCQALQVGNMRADQILTSDFFGLSSARPAKLKEFMQMREQILTKTEFTKEDEQKLDELETQYGALPTGESKLELKTQLLLNKILKNFEKNDTN
ncbi:MAG: hypothetical protein EAZ97_14405 [Bacteroidetes bacterium]|nr:MAG: hypothetical protein EAZ97_14405 [Bacteroidota bacterium]